MASKSTRFNFPKRTSDFGKWLDGLYYDNKIAWFYVNVCGRANFFIGIASFICYRDISLLCPAIPGLVTAPIMYKQAYNYQGLIKAMSLPHIFATVPIVLYLWQRFGYVSLPFINDYNDNQGAKLFGFIEYAKKIERGNTIRDAFIYYFGLFSLSIGHLVLFLMFLIYIHGI